MPVILVNNLEFDKSNHYYYCSLAELIKVASHVGEGGKLSAYVMEIRDERNKLIKRFKAFKKLEFELSDFYDNILKERIPCIVIEPNEASKLNLGKNYKIALIVTRYNGSVLFPFEVRQVGYGSERIAEELSKIEESLLIFIVEQPILNEAMGFLYDSHNRLQEADIEGARTAVRNSLQVLKDKFVQKIIIMEEAKDFRNNIDKLIGALMNFVHYGGPHPGPTPRATTEMVIDITIRVVGYLAKNIEDQTIKLKDI